MGLFKGWSADRLLDRRKQVEREISYHAAFLDKIDRRIEYLKTRQATALQSQDPTPPHIEGEP